jgi:3-deoxy-manno-octulosonate cytidylyltransferase (CMP-KDO synthetase)
VQGDQPLVHPASFDQVVQPLIQDPDLGMSTLAIRINDQSEYHNPKDCKVTLDQQGYALYFSRAPIPFFRDQSENMRSYKHLGIYAYRFWFLEIFNQLPGSPLEQAEKLEQLRALEHGHPIKVVITRFDSPEVDLPEDIKRIEKIMNHGCGS